MRIATKIMVSLSTHFKSKQSPIQSNYQLERCGGHVVIVLAFYSDDPSSIPTEVYNFSVETVVEKDKNKQKEATIGPFTNLILDTNLQS